MIALFGGTFNPIHLGHINMAEHFIADFDLNKLRFLPCATPVHKNKPNITNKHRINMLEQALAHEQRFSIDRRELLRKGPSYSYMSLKELRNEYPTSPILFLIGMDSLNTLTSWYRWQEIIKLCHIIVYKRPGETLSQKDELNHYVNTHKTINKTVIETTLGGCCYFMSAPTFNTSSSEIRHLIKNKNQTEHLLSKVVREYINEHNLYADQDD